MIRSDWLKFNRPGQEGSSRGTCPVVQVSAEQGQLNQDDWWLQAHTHLQMQTLKIVIYLK